MSQLIPKEKRLKQIEEELGSIDENKIIHEIDSSSYGNRDKRDEEDEE